MFTQWRRRFASARCKDELRAALDLHVFGQCVQQSSHAIDVISSDEDRFALLVDQGELNVTRSFFGKRELAALQAQFVIRLFAQTRFMNAKDPVDDSAVLGDKGDVVHRNDEKTCVRNERERKNQFD